ncbi:24562_t:CDS:2, partial [Racocetra persica]
HLHTEGLVERIHGNTERAAIRESKVFLDSSEKTYTSVYNEFKEHFYIEHSNTENIISYFTFRRLWHEIILHLKFQPPASDLCEVCEMLKAKLIIAKSNIDEYEQVKSENELPEGVSK